MMHPQRCLRILIALSFSPLSAQSPTPLPNQTWTLTSGADTLRLTAKDGTLFTGYFGPATQAPQANDPLHPALFGEAEGEPLDGATMLLTSEQSTTPSPGVQVLTFTLHHRRLPIELVAQYTACGPTGVFTRVVTLQNTGTTSLEITSASSLSLDLPKGSYTLRHILGGWGEEHQLASEPLHDGARIFSGATGRSTNGFAPWISLRNDDSKTEYLAELAWSGNWDIQVSQHPGQEPSTLSDQPVALRMNMHWDAGQTLNLAAGASFTLPTAAFLASAGDLDDATNAMHSYQRQFVFPAPTPGRPPLLVQFNSWYPYPGNATLASMERSADVAAKLGAEVFVLDGGWMKHLGDYDTNTADFPHGLDELSAYIRARGMKFGLWVEIENVALESKMFHDHPDWCLAYNDAPIKRSSRCQLNFAKPEVRAWATSTIDRLISTNHLSWIKIDYNIDIGDRFDPHGANHTGDVLAQHVQHYYSWLDTLRSAHPEVIIENSASGGMRMDTGILAHTDTSWLSDNVDPIASLQLGYGCTVQFAPEVCNHWMVGDDDKGNVDPSKSPGWWDFMFRVPMNGQFGLSSRIVDWSKPLQDRAAANIALYKQIRPVIDGADVHHLTPQPAHHNPTGWMAIEYLSPSTHNIVLMAYRLAAGSPTYTAHLKGLDDRATYEIRQDGQPISRIQGSKLFTEGIPITLAEQWRAAIIQITKAK